MNKALELLLQYQYADEIGGGIMKYELNEAIAELEEALKPKNCSMCKHLLQKLKHSDPFCVEHNFWFTHDSKLIICCNGYEPKE
jgi:hypothetical protein